MTVNGESEGLGDPIADLVSEPLPPAVLGADVHAEGEPDELIVRVTDDCAVVFGPSGGEHLSRWGRLIALPTAYELKSLLRNLDPVARAVIEAKRLTGALVELHPADREMFVRGFKAIQEEGGWLQANFRDHGRVTRLMRIRPATGLAVLSGGAFALAAIAAQAQAAEMARAIKAIAQQVGEIHEHLQDDQVGEVESVAEQVARLVGLLRTHGKKGTTNADIAVVRQALGDARHRCLQHLKRAVRKLEHVSQLSAHEVEQMLTQRVVDEVTLYLNLAGRLDVVSVQFGLAEVAYDFHRAKPEVAKTRAEQVAKSAHAHRQEIEEVCRRLNRLDKQLRAESLPSWGRAAAAIARTASVGAAMGAAGGVMVAVGPSVAEAIQGDADEIVADEDEHSNVRLTALLGAATGFAAGLAVGAKDLVLDIRAVKPVEGRLAQLTAASGQALTIASESAPSLTWLEVVTGELATAPA